MRNRDQLRSIAAQAHDIPQQIQVQPLVLEMNGCNWQVHDETLPDGTKVKMLLFVHQSGVLLTKTLLPTVSAKNLATRLAAPPGVEIATPGADQNGNA